MSFNQYEVTFNYQGKTLVVQSDGPCPNDGVNRAVLLKANIPGLDTLFGVKIMWRPSIGYTQKSRTSSDTLYCVYDIVNLTTNAYLGTAEVKKT